MLESMKGKFAVDLLLSESPGVVGMNAHKTVLLLASLVPEDWYQLARTGRVIKVLSSGPVTLKAIYDEDGGIIGIRLAE